MAQYIDSSGNPVPIANELGRGGEGTVYAIHGLIDTAVKIYKRPPDARRTQKLEAMVKIASRDLIAYSAWPRMLVFDRSTNRLAGFSMTYFPSPSFKPFHLLAGPAHASRHFKFHSWDFRVKAARNLAAVVATIHSSGVVVGDLNDTNVLVGEKAIVRIIDADSFQISDDGLIHLCEVGRPEYTPPDLHSRGLSAPRSTNHDAFGLAVLVFQLLFLGKIPFVGIPTRDIVEAIRAFEFPYSVQRQQNLKPPPASLSLGHLPRELGAKFELAFSSSGDSGKRPAANDWINGLDDLQQSIVNCRSNSSHKYWRGLSFCPWCQIENSFNIQLFTSGEITPQVLATPEPSIDLKSAERIVESLRVVLAENPPIAIPPTTQVGTKISANTAVRSVAGLGLAAAGVAATVATGFWPLLLAGGFAAYKIAAEPTMKEHRERQTRIDSAYSAVRQGFERWRWVDGAKEAEGLANDCPNLIARIRSLPTRRSALETEIRKNAHQNQLERFLRGFLISDASLPKIGPTRCAVLTSFGIETAWDVSRNRIGSITGFGPKLTGTVVDWRKELERKFSFNPAIVTPTWITQQASKQIREESATQTRALESKIATAKRLIPEIRRKRLAMEPHLTSLVKDYLRVVAENSM